MIYSSWDIECDRLKLVIMSHFLPFVPPSTKNPKKSEFWKNERKCWRYDHFTHLYQKTTTVWGTVPEILSETHIVILSHFCPFIPLTTRKIKILKKWKMYLEMSSFYRCVIKITAIWCMLSKIWSATDKIFVILSHFLPICLTHNLKNQNFQKMKKSDCFLRYGATDRQSFFLILDHFLPFYQPHRPTPCNPTTSQKSKILKKWETPGGIIILYKCTKIMIICYTVPKIWRVTDVIVIFYFWLFLGAPPKNISNPNKWVWQSFVPQLFHSKFFLTSLIVTRPGTWH